MKPSFTAIATLVAAATASPIQSMSSGLYSPLITARDIPLEKRTSGVDCPGTLSPDTVYPWGFYPVSKNNPDTSYPSSVVAPIVTPNDFCTIFNLFIPATATGKTCTLEFLFPELDQLSPVLSTFNYSGGGHFTFDGYVGYGGVEGVTWNTQPPPGNPLYNPPTQVLSPGHRYVLNEPYPGSCLVNETTEAFLEVGGLLCSNDSTFTFTQSYDSCPIGFFIEIS